MSKSVAAPLCLLVAVILSVAGWLLLSQDGADSPAVPLAQGAQSRSTESTSGPLELAPSSELEEPQEAALEAPGAEHDPTRTEASPTEVTNGVALTGSVLLPLETPADEEVEVIALSAAVEGRRLYSPRGPLERARKGPGAGQGSQPVAPDQAGEQEAQTSAATGTARHGAELIARAKVVDGQFQLLLPANTHTVHLAVDARYVWSRETLAFAVGAAGAPIELPVELGGRIHGVVRLPADAPTGASTDDLRVKLFPDLTAGFDTMSITGAAVERRTRSAAGRYELRAVPVGATYGVLVRHEGLAPPIEWGIELQPGQSLELDLELTHGSILRGRVVDEGGQPIADADVSATFRGMMENIVDELAEAETGEDGAFELLGVPAGKVTVSASKKGYLDAKHKIEDELAEGGELEGIEIALPLGLALRGTLSFPDGSPAAGARVMTAFDIASVSNPMMGGARNQKYGSGKSDEQGRFLIDGISAGPFAVHATLTVEEGPQRGAWSVKQTGVKAGGDDLQLTLERLAQLAGRVEDINGEPVTAFALDATLEGSGMMFGIGAENVSRNFDERADGSFVLEGLRPGSWKVVAAAEGYARAEERVLELPLADDSEVIVFVVPPAAGVAGVVLDSAGAPIEGAEVTLVQDLGARVRSAERGDASRATSDGEGQFRLLGLDLGAHSIVAKREGFASSEPFACVLEGGRVQEDVVLRLRTGGTLTGEVFGPDGEPLPGASVIVQITPSFSAQHMLSTEADGTFLVEHLEPGTWQVVCMPGLADGGVEDSENMASMIGNMKMASAELVDGEETHVVLGAPPANPVALELYVHCAGEPVPDAIVSLVPEGGGGGMAALKMMYVDEEGHAKAQLDGPGAYLATVQMGMGVGGAQNSIEYLLRVPEGDHHAETLELPLGRISGRVLGADGKPAVGCRVTLTVEGGISYASFLGGHYTEITTDQDGGYDIRYLRPGMYTVAAGGAPLGGMFGGETDSGRALQGGVELEDGQWRRDLDFRLERPGTLEGIVRDAGGQPVAEAAIFIRDEASRPVERFSFVTTDAGGRFAYPGLSPGRYSASARASGVASGESAQVRVAAGESASVELMVDVAATLIVIVTDDSDEQVRARVTVTDPEGREVSGMLSMKDIMESFGAGFSSKEQRFGPLTPGKYRVVARMADGREKQKPVVLKPGAERKLKLRLK